VNTEDLIDTQNWTYQTAGLDVYEKEKTSSLNITKNGIIYTLYFAPSCVNYRTSRLLTSIRGIAPPLANFNAWTYSISENELK
jgi:hypothetical protein